MRQRAIIVLPVLQTRPSAVWCRSRLVQPTHHNSTECWSPPATRSSHNAVNGYTDIRRRWDAAVCAALGWETDKIAELGEMLAREPRVRGVAYGQWKA